MPADDPLAGLRALHLPPETLPWWSDIGFSVAAGLALALLAALAFRRFRNPRQSLRKSALAAFESIRGLPVEERRAAQAALLRRVVRSLEGDAAAGASGDAWAAALDRAFRTDLFSAREGRVFAHGLYQRPAASPAGDGRALDDELARLLGRLKG